MPSMWTYLVVSHVDRVLDVSHVLRLAAALVLRANRDSHSLAGVHRHNRFASSLSVYHRRLFWLIACHLYKIIQINVITFTHNHF